MAKAKASAKTKPNMSQESITKFLTEARDRGRVCVETVGNEDEVKSFKLLTTQKHTEGDKLVSVSIQGGYHLIRKKGKWMLKQPVFGPVEPVCFIGPF